MASPPSWTVVIFEATEDEKESVQAVPSSWINGDRCVWPPLLGDRINVALKKGQYSKAWPSHKVRILRNSTYADYNVAREKAKKAEITSDLGTDAEEDTVGKSRVRKPRQLSSSESETEYETPKLKRQKMLLPEPPKLTLTFPRTFPNRSFCNTDEEEPERLPSSPHTSVGSEILETPLKRPFPKVKERTTDKENQPCNCKNVEKTLFVIRNLLLELNGKVDQLLTQPGEAKKSETSDILAKTDINYPINSIDDLNKLNQFLETTEHYVQMVNFLAKQGGYILSEVIRRCLALLLTDDIALQFSFQGRKQKEPFNCLKICTAVLDATEKSSLKTTRKETEQAISTWLKRAPERKRRRT